MDEDKYQVYALVDPRDKQVRYVGQSNNPERRYKEHLLMKTYGIPAKDKWINELLIAGLKPTLTIIDGCDTEQKAYELESYWICHYYNEGADLFNGEIYNSYNDRKLQTRLFARASVVIDRPRIIWKSPGPTKPENNDNDTPLSIEEENTRLRAENNRLRGIIEEIAQLIRQA